MSHTINISGYAFTCDSEYAGNCVIDNIYDPHSSSVKVPCDVLLQFAAEYVRRQKVRELEDMHWHDLLK